MTKSKHLLRRWSEDEIEILRREYPRIGVRVASLLPGRTNYAVGTQAKRLGLVATDVPPVALRHGHASGHTASRAYKAWANMHSRCSPTGKDRRYYAERGITVCEQWGSFAAFLADMGEPPEGLTLDRVNNDGNYEPGNCRWADMLTQAHNRRRPVKRAEAQAEGRAADAHDPAAYEQRIADGVEYADAELVRRAVRAAHYGRINNHRCHHVAAAFACGHNLSVGICKRYGLDAWEMVGVVPVDDSAESCAPAAMRTAAVPTLNENR